MKEYRRLYLRRRREERELRLRFRRVVTSGVVPVADSPIELPSEPVDLTTGRVFRRRSRKRW